MVSLRFITEWSYWLDEENVDVVVVVVFNFSYVLM